MAKTKVPSPMERRHLIEKDLTEARSLALAEAYLSDGRVAEAVIFLTKAGAVDRLAALAEDAVAQGDAFLLAELTNASDEIRSDSERWRALADAAEAVGKLRYAEMARRHARSAESD